jgi:hypothetical protein
MKFVNIYFAFTRPQLSFILRHNAVHRDTPSYLIYFGTNEALKNFNSTGFVDVISAVSSTGRLNGANSTALKIAVRKILESSTDTTNLIFPGLLHPLMNGIYAYFLGKPNFPVYIYAEGISSYLDLQLPLRWRIEFNIYRWIAALRGFTSGVAIKGHPHGLDMPNVKGLIAEYPQLLSRHKKPIESLNVPIPLLADSASTVKEVMFLGQPHLDSRIDLATFYINLADGLQKYFHVNLTYKPHHFEPLAQIKLAAAAGFNIIETDVPFEELIRNRRSSVVVSFRSTALINAPRILGESTEVFTFAPFLVQPPDESGSLDQLRKVMASFGVASFPITSPLGKFEVDLARKVKLEI